MTDSAGEATPQELEYAVEGNIAAITINRPAKLNAMTVDMDRRLNEHVFMINNDDDVRAVIVTGRGGRAFSAGSDLTTLDEYGPPWQYRNRFDARLDYARAVWQIRKPVIAAVDGYCIGGGLEMACGADIRLATPRSSFCAGEIRWGWHGGSGQTQLLSRLVGPGQASRLLLTGDRIDAGEALRIGLIELLVEPDALAEQAHQLAERIAAHSPVAVQRTKQMVRLAGSLPMEAGLLVENDSFMACMMSEDAAEGRAAFAENREPEFRGR